jgi:hypothetical protein
MIPWTQNKTVGILSCFSIVAIHGLNGGSFSTWTQDGKLWLRDFLPSTFPSARIMTFGYNANLFADCASGRINNFANNLIALLAAKRQDSNVFTSSHHSSPVQALTDTGKAKTSSFYMPQHGRSRSQTCTGPLSFKLLLVLPLNLPSRLLQ